ncbi:MAG: rhodanese-like domain-containing protein [Saprospiraceae bacterium]
MMYCGKLFLDARERKEFEVSHLPGAHFIGYDDFDLSRVEKLDKGREVIVYCSVGYRSEKITEKLLAAGFTNVKICTEGYLSGKIGVTA